MSAQINKAGPGLGHRAPTPRRFCMVLAARLWFEVFASNIVEPTSKQETKTKQDKKQRSLRDCLGLENRNRVDPKEQFSEHPAALTIRSVE